MRPAFPRVSLGSQPLLYSWLATTTVCTLGCPSRGILGVRPLRRHVAMHEQADALDKLMSLVRYGIRIATFDLTSRPPSCIAAGYGTKTLAIAQIRETWLEALPWLLEACWVFVRSPKGTIAAKAQTFSWVLYCTVATRASPKRRRGWPSRHRAYCNDNTQRQGSHWPLENALHETEAE